MMEISKGREVDHIPYGHVQILKSGVRDERPTYIKLGLMKYYALRKVVKY